MSGARIQFKRATSSSWSTNNPVLYAGEIGYETNTGKLKVGDGTTAWNSLSYLTADISGAYLNGLADVTITSAANGDFLRWNGTAWVNDAVNLSVDTVGSYVESLVAGTGVTLSNNSGEAATPTIAIGQAVGTDSTVTFAGVNAPLTGNVTGNVTGNLTGNADTATTLATSRTIELTGDVTGSASFNGSANASITATIAANSVALGTDTTGNYISDITAGTGVTVTHTPGEGSSASIAIGQSVATDASVQFAQLNTTGNITVAGILTVSGDLTVNGTTTTVNSTTITVDDPIITVGGDTAPASDDNKDRGVEFRWHDGTSAKAGFFGYDDSTGKFTFIPDATNTSEVFSGTLGTIDVGAVHINGSQIAASALSNGTTGSGSVVLATSPSITSPTITTPTLTLSTSSSSTDAIMSWDSTNKKIQVGNGTTVIDFPSSTLVTNTQAASYTVVLTDKDKLVEVSNAAANTLTVPPNSSVAFPIGSQIIILQTGAGQTTITAGAGVTINATPGLKLRAQWSSATLIKRATNTWVAIGDLQA